MRKLWIIFLIILISTSGSSVLAKKVSTESKGYVGKLPEISKTFSSDEPQSAKPLYEKSTDFNSFKEIKPIPRDNPAFVNVILKENKSSPYLDDVNELILQLENLLICVENRDNVQRFNAKAYFFNKTLEYFKDKYDGKPESNYVSFKKALQLGTYTQSVATLRAEAEKYRPYLTYTGNGYLYNDNIINQQLDYLKTEIEDTITVLKDVR